MEKDIFLQNLPLGKPVFAWLPCQLRLRFYFCYIIRPHSMNQDQCFLDLLATFIGSLKSSYIICLDLLKFLRLGNNEMQETLYTAVQNFAAVVLSPFFDVCISGVFPLRCHFLLIVSFFRVLALEDYGQFRRLRQTPQFFCFDE